MPNKLEKHKYRELVTKMLEEGISLVAQAVKNLPAMQEAQGLSLLQETPLEKGMATTPVFLPGKSHGQRGLAGYSPRGYKELDTTEQLIL